MELYSGPKMANGRCGKTIDTGTIDRGSTVLPSLTWAECCPSTMPGLLAFCKDIQASLKSEGHALRQWLHSTSLWVGKLLVNKPDILLRTGSTRSISVSLCYVDQSVTEHSITRVITSASEQNTLNIIFMCINHSIMKPTVICSQAKWMERMATPWASPGNLLSVLLKKREGPL